jgi:outer membrane lipoprotein-sorting protein
VTGLQTSARTVYVMLCSLLAALHRRNLPLTLTTGRKLFMSNYLTVPFVASPPPALVGQYWGGPVIKAVFFSALCIIVLSISLLPASAYAAASADPTNEAQAKKLIDDMEALYRGEASTAVISMTVVTPDYERTMEMSSVAQGPEKAFIRILAPKKERGIATLKLDQEMWNYFPKINKVIKVPPSMMMGSWMGSDFTNDDLVKQTTLTEEYHLTLHESADQYTIELHPKAQTVTVWGRIDYVIDKTRLLPLAERFYDDRGELIRQLTFSELTDFDGHLLPARLEMIPLNKPGHSTVVEYESLDFNAAGVSDADFTLRNLQSRF